MKSMVAGLIILSANFAVAEDTATSRTQDGSVPLELPDFSQVEKPAPDSKGGMAVSMTCKTANNQILRKGDPGYETCLSSAQSEWSRKDQDRNRANPTSSPELNFKFGE